LKNINKHQAIFCLFCILVLTFLLTGCGPTEFGAPAEMFFLRASATPSEQTNAAEKIQSADSLDLSKVGPIFSITNDKDVHNGVTQPTTFTNETSWYISRFYTYHWNEGVGVVAYGTLSLQAADGTMYGPYELTYEDGQGGVPNAFWIASPKATFPPGTYTVIDSDPSTWAQNKGTDGVGMLWIDGIILDK
jgi:hypothetical protein